MVVESKTNTVTITTQDLYKAIYMYLQYQDVDGNVDNIISMTVNQSGVISSSVGTPTLDADSIVATVVIPLP